MEHVIASVIGVVVGSWLARRIIKMRTWHVRSVEPLGQHVYRALLVRRRWLGGEERREATSSEYAAPGTLWYWTSGEPDVLTARTVPELRSVVRVMEITGKRSWMAS